jgi:hypothetical protein
MTRMGMPQKPVEPSEPGSQPLKNAEHETLARARASGASLAEAWREVGRDPAVGNQWRTFQRPDIQARVEYLRNDFNRMAGISLAALQARLLRIADTNVIDYFEADATTKRLRLRDLTALPRVVTGSIAEVQIDPKGAVKIKTSDRLHAIDSLIKTIGGFAPEEAASAGTTLEQLIEQSMQQAAGARMKLEIITGVPRAPDDPPAELAEPKPAVRRVRLGDGRIP